jgi:DNA ligase 1
MKTKKLYKQSATGAIQLWEIGCIDRTLIIRYGQLHGAMQEQTELVPEGKASRTLREQLLSRIKSRINKQYDKGYKDTIEEAKSQVGTNASGMYRPMLAINLHKVKNINWSNAYVQYKYDGHRCLVTNKGGELYAYSRQGKEITTIQHITDHFSIPEGVTLDGELYYHGQSLQTLASWIKRLQDNTAKLVYHVYDIIDNRPYAERHDWISSMNFGPMARIAETQVINSDKAIIPLFTDAKALGYEGLIVRHGPKGYGIGKRCSSLIKVKQLPGYELFEKEFKVVDILASKDDWGILQCITDEGKPFSMSAPGTMLEKAIILKDKSKYIGRYVTTEYPQLTNDGIPFHAVALRFRIDI